MVYLHPSQVFCFVSYEKMQLYSCINIGCTTMPSLKQKAAWNRAGERLQAYWDRRQLRSVHERLQDVEKCFMGFAILVSWLVGISVYLLLKSN